MSFLGWLFGKKQNPSPAQNRRLEDAEEDAYRALIREAKSRTLLVDSASREKRQSREIIDSAEQAIRAARWPWEKKNDETSH